MADQNISLDDNLITLLGIESLPDERKIKILEKATELVQKRLMLRLLNALTTDEDQAEAEKAMDNPEAMAALMARKFPNLPEVIQEEVMFVKEEILASSLVE